jgi:TRAP-type mannitol/chloroaromatic compound transport system permease small subunit
MDNPAARDKAAPGFGKGRRMQALAYVVTAISRLNGLLGRVLSWFSLAIVLICFAVVVMRYAFRMGSVPLQDLFVWLNGAMFMGIAGYTLLREGHVRVDIFYREASLRAKAIVDMIGTALFILPFVTVVAVYAIPFVERSWALREGSANMGGMPGLYVLKSFLLVFAAVVGLQALAMFLRGLLVLAHREALLPSDLRYPAPES